MPGATDEGRWSTVQVVGPIHDLAIGRSRFLGEDELWGTNADAVFYLSHFSSAKLTKVTLGDKIPLQPNDTARLVRSFEAGRPWIIGGGRVYSSGSSTANAIDFFSVGVDAGVLKAAVVPTTSGGAYVLFAAKSNDELLVIDEYGTRRAASVPGIRDIVPGPRGSATAYALVGNQIAKMTKDSAAPVATLPQGDYTTLVRSTSGDLPNDLVVWAAAGRQGSMAVSLDPAGPWTRVPLTVTEDLYAVATEGRYLTAVGANGRVVRATGSLSGPNQVSLVSIKTETVGKSALRAVHQVPNGDVYAGGDEGILWRFATAKTCAYEAESCSENVKCCYSTNTCRDGTCRPPSSSSSSGGGSSSGGSSSGGSSSGGGCGLSYAPCASDVQCCSLKCVWSTCK